MKTLPFSKQFYTERQSKISTNINILDSNNLGKRTEQKVMRDKYLSWTQDVLLKVPINTEQILMSLTKGDL